MKEVYVFFIFNLVVHLTMACKEPISGDPQVLNYTYHNPVIAHNFADPSILDDRDRSGYFYAYSTQNGESGNENCKYLPIHRSKDLIIWEYMSDGFGPSRPQWRQGSRIWAPDINYINGKYVLYYALGLWNDSQWSASGVAISDSPIGPFHDLGMIVGYENTGVKNSIDPNFIDTGSSKFLFWGSFGAGSGIWAIELSNDGLSVKSGAEKSLIGASNMEGTYVHYRPDGYYYLFASKGSCCNGKESTYHVIVARSKNIVGPYESPTGKLLTDIDYDYTILHSTVDKIFVGTGHNAEILTDDFGQDWLPYHAFWSRNGYNGRCLNIDKIYWGDDGWPFLTGHIPSITETGPKWEK